MPHSSWYRRPIAWALVVTIVYAAFVLVTSLLWIDWTTLTLIRRPSQVPREGITRMAVIGDFGVGATSQQAVAELVKAWHPEFVITTGDNNYPKGSAETIDENIGQFYQEYIYPYRGRFGEGASDRNRFFPSIGNHDWYENKAQAYLDYFELPGNERYYDVTWGPFHLFSVNSFVEEPDGVNRDSPQARWLQGRLAASESPWKIVFTHYPPYTTAKRHASAAYMRWPFKEWGADVLLAGHNHVYERIVYENFLYIINGLGGAKIRKDFDGPATGSVRARYNDTWGAMIVDADERCIAYYFLNIHDELIDAHRDCR